LLYNRQNSGIHGRWQTHCGFDLPEHRVTAQSAAIYAELNNEMDFARKISVLMDDPETCRRTGQTARERIFKELSWPHQQANLLEAYDKVLLEQSGRPPSTFS
jgi:glycosyltransferase involved in cell wall biosynthesis